MIYNKRKVGFFIIALVYGVIFTKVMKIGDYLGKLHGKYHGVVYCSVLNKLTLLNPLKIMEKGKKKYNLYTDSERMSYIREYLSSPESKYQFCKRIGVCCKVLNYWLVKYQIEDKVMKSCEKTTESSVVSAAMAELQKELSLLRAENRKLQSALADESLSHEACEELINLAESTYHIKVRKNSDAK